MKRAILTAAVLAFGLVACNQAKKTSDLKTSNSVTDITTPSPTPAAYQPAPQPIAQPVSYDTMPQAASSSGSYTVKKGDTLYSIARQRYGDGKQWTRIASANPGVKPETLKVGQSILIP